MVYWIVATASHFVKLYYQLLLLSCTILVHYHILVQIIIALVHADYKPSSEFVIVSPSREDSFVCGHGTERFLRRRIDFVILAGQWHHWFIDIKQFQRWCRMTNNKLCLQFSFVWGCYYLASAYCTMETTATNSPKMLLFFSCTIVIMIMNQQLRRSRGEAIGVVKRMIIFVEYGRSLVN